MWNYFVSKTVNRCNYESRLKFYFFAATGNPKLVEWKSSESSNTTEKLNLEKYRNRFVWITLTAGAASLRQRTWERERKYKMVLEERERVTAGTLQRCVALPGEKELRGRKSWERERERERGLSQFLPAQSTRVFFAPRLMFYRLLPARDRLWLIQNRWLSNFCGNYDRRRQSHSKDCCRRSR